MSPDTHLLHTSQYVYPILIAYYNKASNISDVIPNLVETPHWYSKINLLTPKIAPFQAPASHISYPSISTNPPVGCHHQGWVWPVHQHVMPTCQWLVNVCPLKYPKLGPFSPFGVLNTCFLLQKSSQPNSSLDALTYFPSFIHYWLLKFHMDTEGHQTFSDQHTAFIWKSSQDAKHMFLLESIEEPAWTPCTHPSDQRHGVQLPFTTEVHVL